MKKKIFSILLLLVGVFSFTFTSLEAQAEFIDDNTFVISNVDFDINENDVKEFLSFLNNYAETYELFNVYDDYSVAFLEYVNYGGFNIDFTADINNSNYRVTFIKIMTEENINFGFAIYDSNEYAMIDVNYTLETNELTVNEINLDNNFTVIFTLPVPPPPTIYSSLHSVINFFVQPFLDLITDIGVADNIISIGFGSIEWFNFTLLELSNLILSFLVILIFLKVIFKLLKLVVRIITGGSINI